MVIVNPRQLCTLKQNRAIIEEELSRAISDVKKRQAIRSALWENET